MTSSTATCARGLVVLGALLSSSCLTPPVPLNPCTEPGAAPAVAAGGAAAPAPGPAVAVAGKLMIWDGDGKGKGAQGWCEKRPACKVAPVPGEGHSGAGLKYHAEGPDWMGFGWNWFGWWPKTAGTDISPYKNVSFWIRVQGKSAKEGPEAGSINVLLGCSKTDKLTKGVPIGDFVPDFADGQWHEVILPLAEFYKGEGAQFDPKTAWEFRIGTWAADPRNFDIYIDDIGFDNR